MKPEKMSPEDVEYCLRVTKENGSPESARRLRAHIAALTAERDERQRESERLLVRANLTVRDALGASEDETTQDAARRVAGERDGCRKEWAIVRDHLAAANDERDIANSAAEASEEAVRVANARAARMEQERDALRERVRALEEDVADKRALAHKWKTSATGLHATLAGMRQRAGDDSALNRAIGDEARATYASEAGAGHAMEPRGWLWTRWAKAVARYILGEDGAATALCDGRGRKRDDGDGFKGWMKCGGCASCAEPNPTTAESFDLLHERLDELVPTHPVRRALSLLEGRMGAMARALRGCRAHLKCTDGCVCDVCAALAGASAAPTLEEVEERAREVYEAAISNREHQPVALSLAVRAAVRLAPSGTVSASGPCGCGHPSCTAPALTDAPPVFTLEEVVAILVDNNVFGAFDGDKAETYLHERLAALRR
jgi:hypothetical protein